MTIPKAALIAFALVAAAPVPPAPAPAPSEIVAAAPAGDWVEIPVSDLLVMELSPDAKGKARRVVIQLMPPPFSQGWIGNIRTLAAAHWYDGTSINRVQDNYVVQWGDASEKKASPTGLVTVPENAYEFDRPKADKQTDTVLIGKDTYADVAAFFADWPIATTLDWLGPSNDARSASARAWPIHCYGMIGVGRGLSPDTGSGAELYTVIGHAPRHLDRNIAVVGRVIEGIEQLSSLPRGTGPLGFYETPEERVAIQSIRLASELPAAAQPHFEYLSTESDSFANYADARANRRDPFFIRPAGGADICNIPVPVRRKVGG
jgi:cyclophilin family peptidyl-prolyl cis-trans isomerase